MIGPTIYKQLLDKATTQPQEELASHLRGYLAATERDLTQVLAGMLREAYTSGVRDGFHEGLAAADATGPFIEALTLAQQAFERHAEWCGFKRDAPGDSIINRAQDAIRRAQSDVWAANSHSESEQ